MKKNDIARAHAEPSNWSITSNDGTNVVAKNIKSGVAYSGTTAAFNLMIKTPVLNDEVARFNPTRTALVHPETGEDVSFGGLAKAPLPKAPLPTPIIIDPMNNITGFSYSASSTNNIITDGNIGTSGNGTSSPLLATKTLTGPVVPLMYDTIAVLVDRKASNFASCNGIQLGFGRGGSISLKTIGDGPAFYRQGKRMLAANIAKDYSYTGVQALSVGTFTFSPRVSQQSPFTADVVFKTMIGNAKGRPKIVLTFDDSHSTHNSVLFPLMAKYGFKGTLFAVTSQLGLAKKQTLADIKTMYDAGWDVGVNTTTDVAITSFASDALLVADIQSAQDILVKAGMNRGLEHMALSNGAWSEARLVALQSMGIKTARTVVPTQLYDRFGLFDMAMTLPSAGANSSTTTATWTSFVDQALQIGSTQIFHCHELINQGDTVTATNWYIDRFTAFLDYIKPLSDAGLLDVMTISEYYASVKDAVLPA